LDADGEIPKEAKSIVANLFHAIKLICGKVLPLMPISGNVVCADGSLARANEKAHFLAPQNKVPVMHKPPPPTTQPKMSAMPGGSNGLVVMRSGQAADSQYT
jgi:hypothetical protein